MFKKKVNELRVKSCYVCGTAYMFTLEGEAVPGKVLQLNVRKDDRDIPMALIEIAEWDSQADVIAYTVWLDREKFWRVPPDVFVYPYVHVVGVDRRTLEQYLASEGQQGLTRVLHDGQKTYVVHRLGCRDGGYREPWICYLLDSVSRDYNIIAERTTLDDMKDFLIEQLPAAKKTVTAWGHEGCKIYDLVKHGAVADGHIDDSDVFLRVLDLVKTGDVITLPADRRIKVQARIPVPSDVVLDIRDEQFVFGE